MRSPDVMDVGTDDIESLYVAIRTNVRDRTYPVPAWPCLNGGHKTFINHCFTAKRPLYEQGGKVCSCLPEYFRRRAADHFVTCFAV